MAGGILGGFLLGPLALLMFAVSPDRAKCPHCAERVRFEAKVCPHCQRDLA
jgi:predicted amidophosphoribosyltransferase